MGVAVGCFVLFKFKNLVAKHRSLWTGHSEKERLTSVPILCRITFQNVPYKDYKLLVLTSFEVTTVTSMDSQEPSCCDDGHLLAYGMEW